MQIKLKSEFGDLKEYVYLDKKRKYTKVPAKISELGPNDLLSPTYDDIFKMMYVFESSKEFACLLFTQILDVDFEYLVSNIKIYSTEFDRKSRRELRLRGDGVFTIDDIFISLEMDNTNEVERNDEYVGRLYACKKEKRKNKKGKEYTVTKYSDVVQFNIYNLAFKHIDKSIDIRVPLGEGGRKSRMIYIDIYLPNIYEKYRRYGPSELTEAERVILTMFIAQESEIKKLLRKDDIMLRKFVEKLRSLQDNEWLLKKYEEENSWVRASREEGLEQGREEGLEQGREEGELIGIEKGKVETAKSMLKKGLTPEAVQEYTDLPMNKIKNIMTML